MFFNLFAELTLHKASYCDLQLITGRSRGVGKIGWLYWESPIGQSAGPLLEILDPPGLIFFNINMQTWESVHLKIDQAGDWSYKFFKRRPGHNGVLWTIILWLIEKYKIMIIRTHSKCTIQSTYKNRNHQTENCSRCWEKNQCMYKQF